MYFLDDMNFQYFFFSTYLGFFLQAFPVALIAGVVFLYGVDGGCQRSPSEDRFCLPFLFAILQVSYVSHFSTMFWEIFIIFCFIICPVAKVFTGSTLNMILFQTFFTILDQKTWVIF